MKTVPEYINSIYSETRWPFIYSARIRKHCGPTAVNQLQEMEQQGRIRRRSSINGKTLIEVMNKIVEF